MSNDWRNVRVKEEPLSDYEGRASSRSSQFGRSQREHRDNGRREKRSRHSPSPPPPPSQGRMKYSRFSRSRSKSPRERGREREKSRSSRWERSRSRERIRDERRDEGRDNPVRSRDRERDEFAMPDIRRVKKEERSRSRSPPGRQDRRRTGGEFPERDGRPGSRDHGQSSRDRGERSRDCARERDWDNFFNPSSEMSRKANVKREKEEQERKEHLEEFGKPSGNDSEKPKEKEQPNFGLSGKLTEETNTFRGVVIKYSEPPEARKPNKIRWRLYPFKGEESLPVMYVHRQSAYLLGRDRKVADIPVDHPSCSKQHAVLQYRLVPYVRADGSKGRRIRPYIIDLESANGTCVNGNKIDPKRYVELFEKDILKFGFSSREYVLLHDESKDVEDDYSALTPD